MERRKFLGLLGLGAGGILLDRAIPLNRVWSFPRQIVGAHSFEIPAGGSLRYLEAWDCLEGKMVARLDISSRFKLEIPRAIERCQTWSNPSGGKIIIRLPESVPTELIKAVKNAEIDGAEIWGGNCALPNPFS